MPVVKFYASLRQITSVKEESVPGADLRTVLQAVIQNHPTLEPVLTSGDQVRVIITINGQTLDPNTALEIAVSGNDMIAIFPPIGGG
jgi:MoaD family protein